MLLNELDSKKQFIVLAAVVLIVFGLYLYLRVIPAVGDVDKLSKQLKVDQALLKRPNIPEEPLIDIAELEEDLVELSQDLKQLDAQSSTLGKKLPDLNKQQDVMLRISEAARASRVRIVSNVPYLTRKRYKPAESSKKLTAAQQKKRERKIRKQLKRARKYAGKSGVTVGVLTREGELMDKLVNNFEVSRPLHELKIEGTYQNIKAFIEALQGLPWQITVVKIDYNLLLQNNAQGYPQPLIVDMIIGA